jgi:hypothetical protein
MASHKARLLSCSFLSACHVSGVYIITALAKNLWNKLAAPGHMVTPSYISYATIREHTRRRHVRIYMNCYRRLGAVIPR